MCSSLKLLSLLPISPQLFWSLTTKKTPPPPHNNSTSKSLQFFWSDYNFIEYFECLLKRPMILRDGISKNGQWSFNPSEESTQVPSAQVKVKIKTGQMDWQVQTWNMENLPWDGWAFLSDRRTWLDWRDGLTRACASHNCRRLSQLLDDSRQKSREIYFKNPP